MAWPLHGASVSHPLAEHQRGSKVVGGEVEVCAKALQQRDGLASTTRCHVAGFTHNFGFNPWIADGPGRYVHNVMVLSSIKIGAPASRDGT
jgi:hypothetical protein